MSRDGVFQGGNFGDQKPQSKSKHPPEWEHEHELDPHRRGNQNIGRFSANRIPYSANDVKELRQSLGSLFDARSLQEIPIVPEGLQLEQGAVYIDLANPQRGAFTAHDGIRAEPGHWYVPKAETPYIIWNQIEDLNL